MKIPHLQSLRRILPVGLLLASIVLGLNSMPLAVSACPATVNTDPNSSANQVLSGVGPNSADCADTGVTSTISTVVNILSIIVGAAAVIMILVSGFKYITSSGDSTKIGSAKSTLIYALVGLAVAALAQVMVHFVLSQSTLSTSTLPACPADHSIKPPACRY